MATTWTGTQATTTEVGTTPPVSTAAAPAPLVGRAEQGTVSRDARRQALTSTRADILQLQQMQVAARKAELTKQRAARLAAAKKKAAAEQAARRKAAAARKARIKALGYEPGTTDPKSIAKQIMANTYGWGSDQFSCYDNIIMRESMWNPLAENASSGAYGIPQALPASKLAKYGSDWRTNPATQIRWGLDYVKDRYGTPCGAWGFKSSHGWY